MKKVESLSELQHGMRVTCEIGGKRIDDARIALDSPYVYICQDVKNGNSPKDTLGYKYGWEIFEYGVGHVFSCVQDLCIVEDAIENACSEEANP